MRPDVLWTMLGTSARVVYTSLNQEPQSAAELVQQTAKGRATVYRALARLEAYRLAERTAGGWIRPDIDLKEYAYDLFDQGRMLGHEAVRVPGGNAVWAILGHSAGFIYSRLGNTPQPVHVLAKSTGKHRNTVTRALHALRAHGLADPLPDGWIRGPTRLAAVAESLGARAAHARRVRRIEQEREAFREMLASRRRPPASP